MITFIKNNGNNKVQLTKPVKLSDSEMMRVEKIGVACIERTNIFAIDVDKLNANMNNYYIILTDDIREVTKNDFFETLTEDENCEDKSYELYLTGQAFDPYDEFYLFDTAMYLNHHRLINVLAQLVK